MHQGGKCLPQLHITNQIRKNCAHRQSASFRWHVCSCRVVRLRSRSWSQQSKLELEVGGWSGEVGVERMRL